MRKRYENRRQQKRKELEDSLNLAEESISQLLHCDRNIFLDCTSNTPWFNIHATNGDRDEQTSPPFPPIIEIDWSNIPEYIDPALGELEELRAKRKRQQLESLVLLVEDEIRHCSKINPQIIDFGAGSGHLGLIIAYRNPTVRVILAERKEYSVTVAKERITKCNLLNVSIDQRDVQDILVDNPHFDIGVSLHSCGQLTDLSLQLCSTAHASFVLTPCCYGQIANPPPPPPPPPPPSPSINDLPPPPTTTPLHITPSIPMTQFSSLPLDQNLHSHIFPLIVSSADYSNNFDESETSYEKNQNSFLIAKRCMRVVDFDRVIHICMSDSNSSCPDRGSYIFRLTSLFPLTCSPKNNVIIGRYISKI